MTLDPFGRTICMKDKCPAYFEYGTFGGGSVDTCDANLMYFSKTNTLCKLIKEFELKRV